MIHGGMMQSVADIRSLAQAVALSGLSAGRALLAVDGAPPRFVAAGQTHAGVRVLAVGSDHAVVEVQGDDIVTPFGEACDQGGARIVVFNVSGIIRIKTPIIVRAPYITIQVQTAPGDGICIADHPVVISGDNVIVRYIRIRMGDKNQLKTTPENCGVPVSPFTAACMPTTNSGGDDAFGNLGGKNIIIDHCSI